MDMYREEILEHWKNPLNFGQMKGADLVIDQVNPLCGDEVKFYFKFAHRSVVASEAKQSKKRSPRSAYVGARDDMIITDVKFNGNGCAISVATSSMLSEYIKGKSVKAISKLVGQDVLKMIGGNVAPARLKCAFLPLEVIRKIAKSEAQNSKS